MILLLLFLGFLVALVLRETVLAVTGIAKGAPNLLRDVLSRVALAVVVTTLFCACARFPSAATTIPGNTHFQSWRRK